MNRTLKDALCARFILTVSMVILIRHNSGG